VAGAQAKQWAEQRRREAEAERKRQEAETAERRKTAAATANPEPEDDDMDGIETDEETKEARRKVKGKSKEVAKKLTRKRKRVSDSGLAGKKRAGTGEAESSKAGAEYDPCVIFFLFSDLFVDPALVHVSGVAPIIWSACRRLLGAEKRAGHVRAPRLHARLPAEVPEVPGVLNLP